MKFDKLFKQVTSTALLSALCTPSAFAHPGHTAGELLHGLLHVEHIVALIAAGAVAFAAYAFRNR